MRTLCIRCGDTPMPGWPLCAKCVTKAAAEANDGATCSDPLVYERVGAIAWPRHERSAA